MKVWLVGFIVGILAVIGILPLAIAEEPPPPVLMAPSTPHSTTLMIERGAPTVIRTTWPASGGAELTQAVAATPAFTPAVVAPASRVSFESWRRRLPYGLTRDPVVGFLTQK